MNEGQDRQISRRTLLKGAAVAIAATLASASSGKARAAKATKAEMKYQDEPKGDQQCSNCRFFIPGETPAADGACLIVDGSISPQGYCIAYSRKA